MIFWVVLIFAAGVFLLGCVEIFYRISEYPKHKIYKRKRTEVLRDEYTNLIYHRFHN